MDREALRLAAPVLAAPILGTAAITIPEKLGLLPLIWLLAVLPGVLAAAVPRTWGARLAALAASLPLEAAGAAAVYVGDVDAVVAGFFVALLGLVGWLGSCTVIVLGGGAWRRV